MNEHESGGEAIEPGEETLQSENSNPQNLGPGSWDSQPTHPGPLELNLTFTPTAALLLSLAWLWAFLALTWSWCSSSRHPTEDLKPEENTLECHLSQIPPTFTCSSPLESDASTEQPPPTEVAPSSAAPEVSLHLVLTSQHLQ